RGAGIPAWRNPGRGKERRQLPEVEITRRPHDRRVEIVRRALHTIEIGRQFELADLHVDPQGGELCLEHLLERCLAAPHGKKLERDMSAGEQLSRSGGVTRRSGRWFGVTHDGTGRWRCEAEEISVDDRAPVNCQRDGTPDRDIVERWPTGVEEERIGI